MRILGPAKSVRTAIGLLIFFDIFLARRILARCSAWSPWDKLRRATSIPALARAVIVFSFWVLGPMVATILVFLKNEFSFIVVYDSFLPEARQMFGFLCGQTAGPVML